MATKKNSTLLKIVDQAKALGELNHRSFLIKEDLKALQLQGKEDSAFLKRKTRDTARMADRRARAQRPC
jgi:hypothetical protein